MESAFDQFCNENMEANFVFKSEAAKKEYFAMKRKIIRINSFAKYAKMILVYATFAICIVMVIIGKIMFFIPIKKIYIQLVHLILFLRSPI